MKMMALDVGTKTIGVAVSDGQGIIAQPLLTIRRTRLQADLGALEELIAEQGAEKLVVGLPKNMDGSSGPAASRAHSFMDSIRKKLGIEVIPWDERLSTVAAEKALLEADMSRRRRRGVIDKVAAALILQGYLDYASSHRPDTGADDPG